VDGDIKKVDRGGFWEWLAQFNIFDIALVVDMGAKNINHGLCRVVLSQHLNY
jgi:hypothetical protein